MPEVRSNPPVPAAHPFRSTGRGTDGIIKAFFGGNAALTILILVLIIVFLLREGLGFFPEYRRELALYRRAGLEYVDIARKDLTAHEQMVSLLNRSYGEQINSYCRTERKRSEEAAAISDHVTEATSPPREALLRLKGGEEPEEGAPAKEPPPPKLVENLQAKYQALLDDALAGRTGKGLPDAPHLSAEEKRTLLAQLKARDMLSKDDPELLANLRAELAAKFTEAAVPYVGFREAIDSFRDTSGALDTLIAETSETVTSLKESAVLHQIETAKRDTLLAAAAKAKDPQVRAQFEKEAAESVTTTPVDFQATVSTVTARLPEFREANAAMSAGLEALLPKLPASLPDPKAERLLSAAKKGAPLFSAETADTLSAMEKWNADTPVTLFETISGFVTGRDWITGGGWQDFYGIVPLFAGSVMISLIALALAIPLGVGAAIYTNQLAGKRQARFVKPTIEFLQAIPSVVLGFIGIAILGTELMKFSSSDAMSWFPGFPISQRLNMFTAGCLLALMAIPTIFTLSEDALNNVPSAFSEASDALGASKLQTVFRVTVPAAVSGILAAVLLGLGRVIGETMVVLLVAGGRIKVPDFTEGFGTFFQPAHTLTGIIAQELGEVPFGSVHYRALFVVGILLFLIVLLINWSAQRFLKRFRIGHH